MKEVLNTSRVCVAFFFLTVLIDEFPFVFQIFMYPYAIKDNLTGQEQTVETNWLLKANPKPRNLYNCHEALKRNEIIFCLLESTNIGILLKMDAPQSSVSLHVSSCNPQYFVVRALHGRNVLLQDLLDSDRFFTHAMLHHRPVPKATGLQAFQRG